MRVFITGMTGTLGTAIAKLHHERGDVVLGCARDEDRAVTWIREYGQTGTLLIAGASSLGNPHSDAGRLLPSMDRVYHCAAIKHVDVCERQPDAAYTNNVTVTGIVAFACNAARVPLVFVSSDKACLPTGVYGATKLLGEKMVTHLGGAAVRLGNLIGSSGSVFKLWAEQVARGEPVTVTHPNMTRYFITVADAAAFVADQHLPGKVVAPTNMKVGWMGELADYLAKGAALNVVGLRPGETTHQWLIAPGERGYEENRVRYVLDPDDKVGDFPSGVSSVYDAERWPVVDLLKEAGVVV